MMRRALIAGCLGIASGATSAVTSAAPIDYTLLATIPVPAVAGVNQQPNGAFTAFDISFVDPSTGIYYVADRSNASVDIFSGSTLALLGRAGGFAGQQPTTATSGPNGVVVDSATHKLFAGDGPSLVRTFDVNAPASPTPLFAPISTGGTLRADEMAFAPAPVNLVLVANNADSPAFATLIDATTGTIVASHITIPGQTASGGLEQPVWDPNTGTFFISVPTFDGTDPGGVAQISTAGAVLGTFRFDLLGGGAITSCSPTGLALGGSGNLVVGCGNAGTQTIVLDPNGGGSIVATLPQISGSDELYYDPVLADFFVTGSSAGQRVFDVVNDATYAILQSVPLPEVNAHSIAVDPLNGRVFVPLEGSLAGGAQDPLCPLGCIAVFASTTSSVPEPATLPLLLVGLIAVSVVGSRRKAGGR